MTGTAVVELFTSEGCSSCPPADEVLAGLARRRAGGDAVLTLGFHVDYWDHLGWPDPAGSAAWTRRQTAYARALGSRGLYTPQAVVGGRRELVGSDARRLRRAVDEALRAPGLPVRAAARLDGGAVHVAPEVLVEPPPGCVVVAALVQPRLRSVVTRGENAGRTLDHVDVVRGLGTGRPGDALLLAVPAAADPDGWSVTVLLQDPVTHAVHGATTCPIA